MIRRGRTVLIALAAILLAIPLLPGPGVLIIMAAVAEIEEACRRTPGARPAAGFPPRIATPVRHDPLQGRECGAHVSGRRVA